MSIGAAGPRVVVVGGGIAGLAAAYFLRHADYSDRAIRPPAVTVLEASQAVGGKLRSGEVGGIGVDVGAEAVLARRREALDLIEAVGLGDEVVHPATFAASIWSRGELHRIPAGQVMGVPAELAAVSSSGLLSRPAIARLPLDYVLPRARFGADVSAGSYVSARLGREVVDRLVEPLLGGVYAGRADMLSFTSTMPELAAAAREHRSLIYAARHVRGAAPGRNHGPVFAGLPGGVARLAVAVAAASGADIRTGVTVRDLRRIPSGWALTTGSAREPSVVTADAVVLALPARSAARLLDAELPAAAAELGSIDYASVALVTLAYPRAAFSGVHGGGSGFLVPPVEGRIAKGVTFSSAKWRWVTAAEPGTTVARVSIGRYGEEQDLQRDDTELVKLAAGELADLAGVRGTPVDALVTRWGGGLPQYAVGHRDRVRRIREVVARAPGLAVCGAAYDGVGIPACIASARLAVAAILGGGAADLGWRGERRTDAGPEWCRRGRGGGDPRPQAGQAEGA